ncbi:MAG TPA: hypothetical protein VID30_10720 [Bradyrhizobium sp.]|jgi:hypothetical protein
MAGLPTSLSIAVWLTGSIWLVAIVGYLFGAPAEIIYITLGAGIVAGVLEWLAIKRRSR